MKRLVILGLVCGIALLTAVSAPAQQGGCSASPGAGSSTTQRTISLPTGLTVLTGGAMDAKLEIVIKENHSLDIIQNCDCFPPCPAGSYQYSSVRFTGTASVFGGEATWNGEASGCAPTVATPDDAKETTTQNVPIVAAYERTEHGEWWRDLQFSGFRFSALRMGTRASDVQMAFTFDTQCRCQTEDCTDKKNHFPQATPRPRHLHLIAGDEEGITITISASDADGDLLPSGISYSEVTGPYAALIPYEISLMSDGSSGGARGEAKFAVRYSEPDITEWGSRGAETAARFTVWDERWNKTTVDVPVTIWSGRPTIEVVEEECRWDRGEYQVAFRVHDADLEPDACQRQAEILTCEIIDVVGGTARKGSPYWLEYVCGSGATENGITHTVGFTPSPESDSQSFTFRVTDKAGHEASIVVSVNHPPEIGDETLTPRTTAYQCGGGR